MFGENEVDAQFVGGGFVDFGAALFTESCILALRYSGNPLATASGSETRFGVALFGENGVDASPQAAG
ncbi:MAG: hypothetical protein IKX88_05465 [Thermoguttaceae bacterium]|nr:hypothetical protein [Thermoguttaceae bacterium]